RRGRTVQRGAFDRVGQDPLDGSRAAAAPGAAAEAGIKLSGPQRRSHVDHAAHVAVADHVAGTDDHVDSTELTTAPASQGRSRPVPSNPEPSSTSPSVKPWRIPSPSPGMPATEETGRSRLYSSIDAREFARLGSLSVRLEAFTPAGKSASVDGKSPQR